MPSLAMCQTKFRPTDKKVCSGYVIHKPGEASMVFRAASVKSIKLLHLIHEWDERTPPNK